MNLKSNRLYTTNIITKLMNPIAAIPLFSAITNVIIGVYVFLSSPKKNTNRVFSVLVFLIAIFCISEFMVRISQSEEAALFWGRIGYSMLPLISCMVIHFSLVFPRDYPANKNIFKRNKYALPLLYIIGVVLAVFFNFFTSVNDVYMSKWGFRVLLNNSTNFVVYWFLLCGVYATYQFFCNYRRKEITNNEKKQIKLLAIGFLIILSLSLGTNLVPPLLGLSVFPMTTISTTIFLAIVTYSIVKYNLMKLTAAETADAVVDTMTDSLVVIDETHTIVNVNASLLNLLGYTRQELQNTSLNHITDLPFFEKDILSKVLTSGKVENVETTFVTKEGNSVPMSVSASGICDEHGKLEGIVIVARDLTEIKNYIGQLREAKASLKERVKERTKDLLEINKALEREISERQQKEKELAKSEEKYRTLIEESPDGLLIVQGNTIRFANKAMLTILGCRHLDEVVNHDFTEFIAPEYQQTMMRGSVREQGKQVENHYEFTGLRKDGTPFDAELSVSVIDYEGKPARQGIIKDVTIKKQALRELQETHEMLQVVNKELERKVEEQTAQVKALLKQKDEFINQLGHDLKNPLTPLVTLLPIIEKKQTDPKAKELVGVTLKNVHYMRDLVGKTLELARLNSPSNTFDIQKINLLQRAKNVISSQQLLFQQHNIDIKNNIAEDLMVRADQLRLDELFHNLLTNAVKYTKAGGKIILDAQRKDDEVMVSIKDTGIGMNKKELNRIFDEFYMADTSRHTLDSSGLGLAISKRIVEKHGGRIWADSKGKGKGSVFYFTLRSAKKQKKK